jgi:hypothetical protein
LEFTLARRSEDGNPAASIVRMRLGSDETTTTTKEILPSALLLGR